MKQTYGKHILQGVAAMLLFFGTANAQCPAITCPANITVSNDSGSCGAVVSYTAPVGTNPCAVTTQTFNYTGAIVNWTVPAGVTSVTIEARGAQGGYNTTSTTQSGLGATMIGTFSVTPGSILKVLVGEQPSASGGNGGGGGSFVTDNSNNPMIVAGGGGGSSQGNDSPDKHGQVGTSGGTGAGGGGVGGTAGSGGGIGASGFQSGAGGGLLTNGSDGWTAGTGGFAFVNGGAGGPTNGAARGGFGGGGSGSSYVVGGGGGGYSGGGSGGNTTAGVGGGGGSFNSGTNQTNTGGANTGHGVVIITYTNASTVTTTMTAGLGTGGAFPIGTTTETYMADDGLGNTVSCSFTITVDDTEDPAITAPSGITVNADSGMCSAVVTYTAPVGTDNCAGATTALTSGIGSGGTFPVGTTTETYTVTDAAGNTATASFTITVADAEAPVVTCPANITVNNDSGMCGAVVTYSAPSGVDNCSGATTSLTSGIGSGGTFPIGTTTETYTVTDGAGNTATCSFDITVVDNEAPAIVCPSAITVNNDSASCGAIVTYSAPVATDNCSGTTTALTSGTGSGNFFPIGTTTEVFTATDASGNTTTCTLLVTVVDNEAPSLECFGNVTSCDPVVNNIAPASFSDNCSGATITYTLSGATTGSGTADASGTTFNAGTTTVSYFVTDAAGNSDSCSFDIVVTPVTASLAPFSSSSVCTTDPAFALPAGTPSGGTYAGTGVVGTTFSPSTAGAGTYWITYTVTSGNCSASDSSQIVVSPCVGISENGLSAISVYPNPTTGSVTIDLGTTYESVEFQVTGLNGNLLMFEKQSDVNVIRTDISELAAGMYLLQIKAGEQTVTVKLIRN